MDALSANQDPTSQLRQDHSLHSYPVVPRDGARVELAPGSVPASGPRGTNNSDGNRADPEWNGERPVGRLVTDATGEEKTR